MLRPLTLGYRRTSSKFISKLTRKTGKVFLPRQCIGAGEFFKPNINADYFPWDAHLLMKEQDYGLQDF